MQLDLPSDEIAEQERAYPGDVCFIAAFDAALHSFFFDARDPDSAAALLAEYGRHLLAHPTSRLGLARIEETAPWGEQAEQSWLFVLSIPAISDHQFWTVVSRERDGRGHISAYNYGFN